MERLGIDIGGTGIKGALVDLDGGTLTNDRYRIPTPRGATPADVAEVVRQVAEKQGGEGPVGITFPGVVMRGVVKTAANMDQSWVELDADALFTTVVGRPVHLMNDADAAGVAEVRYGAGLGRTGVVVLITLGTGIGSAVLVDGRLVPNTELGHIELDGRDAETQASGKAQEREKLSWKDYGKRVQRYLRRIDAMFWPELIIVGGGISKESDKLFPFVSLRAELVAAQLLNNAGIVGAAVMAQEFVAE
jgi:polyphosphate glucokinase